jgi:membrane protease subunit HflK
MAGNSGGPWGGGGNSGGNSGGDRGNNGGGRNNGGGNNGGRGPGDDGPQIPEIDELMKKGQEQLRVLMGGRGRGGGNGGGGTGGGGGGGPALTRGTIGLGAVAALVLWGLSSFTQCVPNSSRSSCFWVSFQPSGQRV